MSAPHRSAMSAGDMGGLAEALETGGAGRQFRIGYLPGVYDLFHVGHLNMFRRARPYCDLLIAGAVTDEKALATKGKLPVIPLAERLEILEHCSLVDQVYAESADTKFEVWQELGFNAIFKGDDWRGTAKGLALEAEFAPVQVTVVYFPYTAHTSSSVLRRALQALDPQGAQIA